jgi:hypothetical protein
MNGLVGCNIGSANPGVKSVEILLEQTGVQLHLKIAARPN